MAWISSLIGVCVLVSLSHTFIVASHLSPFSSDCRWSIMALAASLKKYYTTRELSTFHVLKNTFSLWLYNAKKQWHHYERGRLRSNVWETSTRVSAVVMVISCDQHNTKWFLLNTRGLPSNYNNFVPVFQDTRILSHSFTWGMLTQLWCNAWGPQARGF